jgi:hypothetical protein
MTGDAIVVNIAVMVILVSGFIRNWCVARAKLRAVYWCMIAAGTFNGALNIAVVGAEPRYWSLMLFNVLIVHSVWSAFMGLRRLNALDN